MESAINSRNFESTRITGLFERLIKTSVGVLAIGSIALGCGAKDGTEIDQGIIGCGVNLLDDTPSIKEALVIISDMCDRFGSLGEDQVFKHAEVIMDIAENTRG
jgi:hypothetical protein